MSLYEAKFVNGEPTFKKPVSEIVAEVRDGGAIQVLSPTDYHTSRQRKWYRGICLRGLSDWNGDTPSEWDDRLKRECGGTELLKTEPIWMADGNICSRLTIRGVGKQKMTAYIENILSKSIEMEWPVTPPDPDLRKDKMNIEALREKRPAKETEDARDKV